MKRYNFYRITRELVRWCVVVAVALTAIHVLIPVVREIYARKQFEKILRVTQNSAEVCMLCEMWNLPPVGLLCVNSGECYSLDLFDGGNQRDDGIYGYIHFSNGGDRLTGLRFEIEKIPDEKQGMVKLWPGSGYVDACEIKKLYCDSCIEELLEAMEGSEISGLVVVGGQGIYPVCKGSLWTDSYHIVTSSGRDHWAMDISYDPS